MGRLTTHILDTVGGCPAPNVKIDLYLVTPEDPNSLSLLCSATTNQDGRTDAPLLADDAFKSGIYQLVFHMGDYFIEAGLGAADPLFLDDIPIRFGISDADQHYHVPLLASPYSFSTYRGS